MAGTSTWEAPGLKHGTVRRSLGGSDRWLDKLSDTQQKAGGALWKYTEL